MIMFKIYVKKLTENYGISFSKSLIKFLFDAQFNYYPLIWIFHSRQNNKKFKHMHERCLPLIQNDKLSSYEELLGKDESVSVHHRNIQSLDLEMFQIKHNQSREIVAESFTHATQE